MFSVKFLSCSVLTAETLQSSHQGFSSCFIISWARIRVFVCLREQRETELDLSSGKLRDSAKQQQNNKKNPVCGATGDVQESFFAFLGFWEQTAHYF